MVALVYVVCVHLRPAVKVVRLCTGGEIAFCLPVTAAQFINECSLFVLLLNVVRHAETAADI